jgi:integrase
MPYQKGSIWVAQVRKGGMRRGKIFQTKKEAQEWEVQQRKLPADKWKEETSTTCLHEWASEYMEFSINKHSRQTYKEKQGVFKRLFLDVDPTMPVERLARGQVLKHLQKQNQKRSGYAANKDRKNLIAAWNWGKEYMGLPNLNPFRVARFPEVRSPRYIPSERDFWAVYDLSEGQDKVMLLAFRQLAARRKEIFTLRWKDVNFSEGTARLWTRKRMDGNLECEDLPMDEELAAALRLHSLSSHGEWVFTDPETGLPYSARRRWMPQACKRAGVRPFGVHAIRHLSSSVLAHNNVPMVQIQGVLRHKNLATTERYIKRLTDLRPALRFLSKEKSRLVEPSHPTRRDAEVEVNV